VPLPYGSIGQELTGAGAAFNAAMLSDIYGSIASAGYSSSNTSDVAMAAQQLQLHPRLIHGSAGANVSFAIYPAMMQAQWANASLHIDIDGPPVQSWLLVQREDATTQPAVGSVVVGVPPGAAAGSALELVVWLLGTAETVARPSRQVIVVDAS
jgi:hypothetical protein